MSRARTGSPPGPTATSGSRVSRTIGSGASPPPASSPRPGPRPGTFTVRSGSPPGPIRTCGSRARSTTGSGGSRPPARRPGLHLPRLSRLWSRRALRAELVHGHRLAVAAAGRRFRLADELEPSLLGDASRRRVADVGLEQQPDAELAASPVGDQTERLRGDATASRLPLEPVADLGAVVLAVEAVDADRAEQPARLRIDDHERRVAPLLPRARRTLDEIRRVGACVRRRDASPPGDLGVLARLGDRVDVAGRGRSQHDLVVAETGDRQSHPARVTERRGVGLRITAAP